MRQRVTFRQAPALDDRGVHGTLLHPALRAQHGQVPDLQRASSTRSTPLGQTDPKPTVLLPTHLQTLPW